MTMIGKHGLPMQITKSVLMREGDQARGASHVVPCTVLRPQLGRAEVSQSMFTPTNPKLLRKIKRRQAIAAKMPQTKAEARKACFEAAQQHRITKLPDGKPSEIKRGSRINHKSFEAMR